MAQDLNIIFYDKNGLSEEITSDTPNLGADFVTADCRKGQCIIYEIADYDPCSTNYKYQILQEGQGVVALNFTPRSIRRVVTFGTEGVTLYEHNGFGGKALVVPDHIFDITFGVSSMIISGGRWELYTKPDSQGLHITKEAGKYPTPGDVGFPNDQLKSIKRFD